MNTSFIHKYIGSWRLRILILSLSLFLAGCDDADQEALLKSAWGVGNLEFIKQSNAASFSQLENYELWVGRVERHNQDNIMLVNAISFETRRQERVRRASRFRNIDWPADAYPRLIPGEYIAFVAIRDLKGRLIVLTDRVAKLSKPNGKLLVTPFIIKRHHQIYRKPESPLEISAGTGKATYAPGEPVNLTIEFANYGQEKIIPMDKNPAELTLEMTGGPDGAVIPPKSPGSIKIPIPEILGGNETRSIKLNLADLFNLSDDSDYTVLVTGPESKFRLGAIEFEVENPADKLPPVIR
ncbi:MAG: hypothetical protein AB7F32_09355 [Victivallaceae bacterium]